MLESWAMDLTLDIAWQVGLGVSLLMGCVLAVFQLPGTWLILVVSGLYAWHFEWARIAWSTLALLAVLAAGAELAELLAGMRGARRAGATPAASWGALIGGFCGMILFSVIPLPIIAQVAGGVVGCFSGALIVEYHLHGDLGQGSRVGYGAAVGRLVGMMVKLMTAFVMSGIVLGAALF